MSKSLVWNSALVRIPQSLSDPRERSRSGFAHSIRAVTEYVYGLIDLALDLAANRAPDSPQAET
jgi:hypothetical protein